MKEPKQETVIRRYLLGELNDDDREHLEQRLITDRNYMEEVLMVEEELLEDYVSGKLPESDRDLFRKNYLSAPRQKQKLRIAQALDRYASRKVAPAPKLVSTQTWIQRLIHALRLHSGLMQLAWAVLVLVVLAGTWLIVRNWRSENALQAEINQLNGPETRVLEVGQTVSSALLSPVSLRDSGRSPVVTITHQTEVVQLQIPYPTVEGSTYRTRLKDSNGRMVAQISNVTRHELDKASLIVLQFPVRLFQPGDYVVTITESDSAGRSHDVGDYAFRVVHESSIPTTQTHESPPGVMFFRWTHR